MEIEVNPALASPASHGRKPGARRGGSRRSVSAALRSRNSEYSRASSGGSPLGPTELRVHQMQSDSLEEGLDMLPIAVRRATPATSPASPDLSLQPVPQRPSSPWGDTEPTDGPDSVPNPPSPDGAEDPSSSAIGKIEPDGEPQSNLVGGEVKEEAPALPLASPAQASPGDSLETGTPGVRASEKKSLPQDPEPPAEDPAWNGGDPSPMIEIAPRDESARFAVFHTRLRPRETEEEALASVQHPVATVAVPADKTSIYQVPTSLQPDQPDNHGQSSCSSFVRGYVMPQALQRTRYLAGQYAWSERNKSQAHLQRLRGQCHVSKVYVDTGAGISIVGEHIVRSMGLEVRPAGADVELVAANGGRIEVTGVATLAIMFDNREVVSHECQVVPAFRAGALLANDFVKSECVYAFFSPLFSFFCFLSFSLYLC